MLGPAALGVPTARGRMLGPRLGVGMLPTALESLVPWVPSVPKKVAHWMVLRAR